MSRCQTPAKLPDSAQKHAPTLERRLECAQIMVKDEGRLPTGSFKCRGMAVAVSMARSLGVTRIAIPTAGNAGAGLAAYASRAGIESFVFTPADTPEITASEIAFHGARAWRVDGLVGDCAKSSPMVSRKWDGST